MSEPSALEFADRIEAVKKRHRSATTSEELLSAHLALGDIFYGETDAIVAALRAAPAQEPAAWPDRESIAKVFALIWHGDVGEWEGFLSKADAFLACPWLDIPRAAPSADAKAAELVKALEAAREHVECCAESGEPGWKGAQRLLMDIDSALAAWKARDNE